MAKPKNFAINNNLSKLTVKIELSDEFKKAIGMMPPDLPDACPECDHSSSTSTWHRVFNTNLWNCMRCGNLVEGK
jgi:hypothetical protein